MSDLTAWFEAYRTLTSRVTEALVQGDAPLALKYVMEQQDLLQRATANNWFADMTPQLKQQLHELLLQADVHGVLLAQMENSLGLCLGAIATETKSWNARRQV